MYISLSFNFRQFPNSCSWGLRFFISIYINAETCAYCSALFFQWSCIFNFVGSILRYYSVMAVYTLFTSGSLCMICYVHTILQLICHSRMYFYIIKLTFFNAYLAFYALNFNVVAIFTITAFTFVTILLLFLFFLDFLILCFKYQFFI